MKGLVSALRGARTPEQTKTPVPYTTRHVGGGSLGGLLAPSGAEAQMRAMGGNGTLFAVVDAYATAEAGVDWHLYRGLPPGSPEGTERQVVPTHPALDLWNRPNSFFSQPRFVKTVTQPRKLVGEGIVVVAKVGSLPIELWPVMPHRMEPVKDPKKFIAGWIYHGPGGEKVPLENDVVIQMIQTPCPWDPYRGMGAVQTIMADLYGASAAAEWHRQFFVNSARPDGVIQVPQALSDTEFEEFNERWKEAHQGVLNAHRVAILEYGAEWQPTGYSPHDMQFVELRRADAENIREAFRMSETVLGRGETLNRAVAEAQMFQFASTHVVPDLDDWKKELLNGRLLPMYGPTGRDVEFDYVSPVPEDAEARDRNIVAQATAYKSYVEAGVDGSDESMLRHLGLPKMERAPKLEPTPALSPSPPKSDPEQDVETTARWHRHGRTPKAALSLLDEADDEDEPDLSGVSTDLDDRLAQLEAGYASVLDEQIDSLVEQVEAAVDDDDLDDLTAAAVPAALLGTDDVQKALTDMATTAAERASGEVADQDVEVDPDEVAEEVEAASELGDVARAVAATVAADLALSAVREALRLWSPGADGAELAGKVREFLTGLKGLERTVAFGAALHRATNLGRGAAFTVALRVKSGGTAVASEQNDRNRCGPCGDFSGHVFATLDEAQAMYGAGGYPYCQGRRRCRGTYHVTWN